MATSVNSNAYNMLPRASGVIISTANPYRDGAGALGTVIAATSNGVRVETFRIIAAGPVTDGMIRLYMSDGTGAHYLISEIAVTATTPSATSPVWQYAHIPAVLLVIPGGYAIKASTEKGESFHITAIGWSL